MKNIHILVLLPILLIACSEQKQQAVAASTHKVPPTSVTLVSPEAGEMYEFITVPGSLAASESAIISTEINGIVDKVHIADGENISKGTLLFSIKSNEALAELQHAEATVVLRLREKQRVESLFEREIGSQREVDEAIAELLTAEADRDFYKAHLEKASIKAPFAGKVGIHKVNVGSYVKAGTGLINLVKLDPMFLDFSMPETVLSNVTENVLIDVEIPALGDNVYQAKVVALEPEINIKTRSRDVRAKLDNREGKLLPGLFARVRLPVKHEKNILWVPETSIFYDGSKRFVMINDNGKSLRKEVNVVSFQNGRAAILSGLTAGDSVVSAGHHKILFDGMPLLPVPSDPQAINNSAEKNL